MRNLNSHLAFAGYRKIILYFNKKLLPEYSCDARWFWYSTKNF